MTIFLRLLTDNDKAVALKQTCASVRSGIGDSRVFEVQMDSLKAVPGYPFSYWVSDSIRGLFKQLPGFEKPGYTVKQGLATADDFRFLRCWWEIKPDHQRWPGFAKGGASSSFYADVHLVVNWSKGGAEIKNNLNERGGVRSNVWMLRETEANHFRQPGLTFTLARTPRFSPRALPRELIFGHVGSCLFVPISELGAVSALLNSSLATYILRVISISNWEVGYVRQLPMPPIPEGIAKELTGLAARAWSARRRMDSINESSHAFLLPSSLRARVGNFDTMSIDADLKEVQSAIDEIAFDLYGISSTDRKTIISHQSVSEAVDLDGSDEISDDENSEALDNSSEFDSLLSWGVGVAFGRFDSRKVIGQVQAIADPDPFDPLPAKSPGMLPDDVEPFHVHAGILVDDAGHPHDLVLLLEKVLLLVDAPVRGDLRRWLHRDFFPFHLGRYSKSRRKAPIYWPLSTTSGAYTLWIYYESISNQTLYTAINDFVEPKLKQIAAEINTLRNKGAARSHDNEKQYETLQVFEQELTDLRATLLKIAPTFQPNHDDGVQITAAPLWPLFRHKPWQKVLKDTWTKLEKGDYDWAHLAIAYWPERIRAKCKTDKSLAIAHNLEALYVEPTASPKKAKKVKA